MAGRLSVKRSAPSRVTAFRGPSLSCSCRATATALTEGGSPRPAAEFRNRNTSQHTRPVGGGPMGRGRREDREPGPGALSKKLGYSSEGLEERGRLGHRGSNSNIERNCHNSNRDSNSHNSNRDSNSRNSHNSNSHRDSNSHRQ